MSKKLNRISVGLPCYAMTMFSVATIIVDRVQSMELIFIIPLVPVP